MDTASTNPTSAQSSASAAYNGVRIAPMRPGALMGSKKGNTIIRFLNSLLTMKVVQTDSQTGQAIISDGGTIIGVPKGAAATTTATGSDQLMEIITIHDWNWLTCRPDGAPSDGSLDVSVATQPTQGNVIGTETFPDSGETWTYRYPADLGVASNTWDGMQSRRATLSGGTTVFIEKITPRWIVGQKILVGPCSNTGVFPGGGSIPAQYITKGPNCWAEESQVS